ncbi:hypothetical protein HK099_008191, partial [Clydaea vesicula]
PLYTSCSRGHKEISILLMQHPRTDLNFSKKDGSSPLYVASQNNNFEIVKALLDTLNQPEFEMKRQRLNINIPIHDKSTPLIIAAQLGWLSIVKILVEYGADLNLRMSGGYSAFYVASSFGQTDVVNFFISLNTEENRVKIDAKADDGTTALDAAKFNNHSKVVEILTNIS